MKYILTACLVMLQQSFVCLDVQSIYDIMKGRSDIQYIKCHEVESFYYKPFPISKFPWRQPNQGIFAETFIAVIPNGRVFSCDGFIRVQDSLVMEFIPQDNSNCAFFAELIRFCKPVKKIDGRVAVIASSYCKGYFHWMIEVMAKLMLLQKEGVEYDWLYVNCNSRFMKKTLELFGVDLKKVIQPSRNPYSDYSYIEADFLIAPSYPNRIILENNKKWLTERFLGFYVRDWVLEGLRNCILPLTQSVDVTGFCKRVYISRGDSNYRIGSNEDEIFALFKNKGFKKYTLSELSVVEQAALFGNAEWIAGEHGAGFTNILFCKPGTNILEIFGARSGCDYFYISQQLQLHYQCIKTVEFPKGLGFKSIQIPKKAVADYLELHPIV